MSESIDTKRVKCQENLDKIQQDMILLRKQFEYLFVFDAHDRPVIYSEFYHFKFHFEENVRKYEFVNRQRRFDMEVLQIQNRINSVKTEITEKAELRGKSPNFDVLPIRQLQAKLDALSMPTFVESDNPLLKFVDYKRYIEQTNIYFEKHKILDSSYKLLYDKLCKIDQCIEEDTWREKYQIYAKDNDIDVDEYTIFEMCNTHRMNVLLNEIGKLKCPCSTNLDPDEDEYEHTFIIGETRCSRGRKIYFQIDESYKKEIGFIETSTVISIEEYITMNY